MIVNTKTNSSPTSTTPHNPRTTPHPHSKTNKQTKQNKKKGGGVPVRPHQAHTTPHPPYIWSYQSWHKPTLPNPPRCSTISAHRLSNRVRKGQPGVTLRLSPPTHPTQLVLCQTLHSKHETTHHHPQRQHAFCPSPFPLCCQHTHMFPTSCALSHTILWHTTTYYLW